MGNQLFSNNAASTLASGISSGATSLSVAVGDGAKFPALSGGDFFLATLTQGSGTETSWEIVKVTGRASDTFTIVRAQEGTAAAAWATGSKVELRFTAASVAPSAANLAAGGGVALTAGTGSSVSIAQKPRASQTYTTATLSPNQTESTGYLDIAKVADLTKLVATHPCWVRVYGSAAARSADASRAITSDPAPSSGIYLDAAPGYSGFSLTLDLSPISTFIALDGANPQRAFLAIQNLDTNTETIGVTLTYKEDEN